MTIKLKILVFWAKKCYFKRKVTSFPHEISMHGVVFRHLHTFHVFGLAFSPGTEGKNLS